MPASKGQTAAIVLTGGTGARLGGLAKGEIEVGGRRLLDRVLDALGDLPVVVVGDEVPTVRPVRFTRETPPGGGPAAGALAGLQAQESLVGMVILLAVDLPGVSGATVDRLLSAARGDHLDGAVLVDADGRRQPLCAAYDVGALRAAAPADTDGLAMHRLVAGLRLAEVPAIGDEAADVDTPADLARLRRL